MLKLNSGKEMLYNCVQMTELFIYLFIYLFVYFFAMTFSDFHRCVNFPLGFQIPLGNVLEIAVKVKVFFES